MIHYISPTGPGDAWVVNELEFVDKAGIPFHLHALRAPRSTYHVSPWGQKLATATSVIYPLRFVDVIQILMAPLRFNVRFASALLNALFGERESPRNRAVSLLHLLVACAWVARLKNSGMKVSHIHSQWIHAAGTVGMYGAWLLNVPFSFTGHAADLYRERVALKDKIRRAEFIGCISTYHQQFFRDNGALEDQLRLVYCGIDVSKFYPKVLPGVKQGLKIRSSGRLVEKKGLEYLIDACGILNTRAIAFDCVIAGSGPLEQKLRDQVQRLGLQQHVSITGTALKQEHIPDFMHGGNVYCLPCVWAADNDVDGLPQMLMEAMACGLPSISTRLVGIPDLIIDQKTGLLVEPRNAEQLADAIVRFQDQQFADTIAEAGRQHVLAQFEIEEALQPLLNEYRQILKFGDEVARCKVAS